MQCKIINILSIDDVINIILLEIPIFEYIYDCRMAEGKLLMLID